MAARRAPRVTVSSVHHARRAFSLLEVLVGSLCLVVLVVPILSFTRTTRELSRVRMVQLEAVRELETTLDLLAALPLAQLFEATPFPGFNGRTATPLDGLLDGDAAVDRRAGIANLVGDIEIARTMTLEELRDHPGLFRLELTLSYKSHADKAASDEPWNTIHGERLIWRKR